MENTKVLTGVNYQVYAKSWRNYYSSYHDQKEKMIWVGVIVFMTAMAFLSSVFSFSSSIAAWGALQWLEAFAVLIFIYVSFSYVKGQMKLKGISADRVVAFLNTEIREHGIESLEIKEYAGAEWLKPFVDEIKNIEKIKKSGKAGLALTGIYKRLNPIYVIMVVWTLLMISRLLT